MILRSDDFKYAVSGTRSRVGFYLDPELPWLGIDIDAKYFTGTRVKEFAWSSNITGINSQNSKMMKYTITYKNLSHDLLETDKYGRKDVEEDNLSNPTVSLALPYLENLSEDSFQFVQYRDDSSGSISDYYIGDNYKSTAVLDADGGVETQAENLDKKTPQWTWHVENEKGEFVALQKAGDLKLSGVDLENKDYADAENTNMELDTQKTPNPYFVKKPISTNVLNRKIVNFKFSGTLKPGLRIVVEMMVPLDTTNNSMVSTELMQAKAYGFKEGTFNPYIPMQQDRVKMVAYEVDSHDVNQNRNSRDMAITITSQAITLMSTNTVTQMKTATSELDTVNSTIPVQVPEGSRYSYAASLQNTSNGDTKYNKLLFYDVLPYHGDTKASDKNTPRNSLWNGYLIPESVQLKQVTENVSSVLNQDQYTIWVGPIVTQSGKYVLQNTSQLPTPPDDAVTDADKKKFYEDMYGEVHAKDTYFVKLSDLIAAHEKKKISDAEYETLVRGIRAVWAELKNVDTSLTKKSRLELYYEMHAPLNLPKYVGTPISNT